MPRRANHNKELKVNWINPEDMSGSHRHAVLNMKAGPLANEPLQERYGLGWALCVISAD